MKNLKVDLIDQANGTEANYQASKPLTAIKYRPEIDGLRAIAVLSVILFHADFDAFGGGFIGVDVFFVISGYLISTIILTEKQNNVFSLLGFYERRARRILPPLYFVMLVCLPLAWILMLPDQLYIFSKSLTAVSIFLSNIFFLHDTGYFSEAVNEKPLIHMWSLGIEEQYYVLFPLLIILFWRVGFKNLVTLVAIILTASLVMSEYAVRHHPSAAFFLIYSRAWELLVGSSLACISFKKSDLYQQFSPWANQVLSCLGLLFIVYSVLFFKKSVPFPGFNAIMPVMGAALIIAFSNSKTIVSRFLSCKCMVGVGLVSYSAYLWHQPLFSFARLYNVNRNSAYLSALLVLVSLVLAFLTWKFIEKPCRNKNIFTQKQIILSSIVGMLFFIGIGAVGSYEKGFPERLSVDQKSLLSVSHNIEKLFNEKGGCFLGPNKDKNAFGHCVIEKNGKGHVLLWGDSYAAHLYSGLKTENQYHKFTQLTASGCPPILDVDFNVATLQRPHCREINNYVLARIKKDHPDKVILAARWGWYGNVWPLLKNTVYQLKKLGIKDIIIIGPAPIWDDFLPHILAGFNLPFSKLPNRLKSHGYADNYSLDLKMKDYAQSLSVDYISIFSILCNDDGCLIKLGKTPDNIVNFDNGHLTEAGSKYVVSKFPTNFWKKL